MAKVLNAKGMKCPQPIFEVFKMMKNVDAGEHLEVRADDPAFRLDIEAWCKRTGNALVELTHDGAEIVAKIRKAA